MTNWQFIGKFKSLIFLTTPNKGFFGLKITFTIISPFRILGFFFSQHQRSIDFHFVHYIENSFKAHCKTSEDSAIKTV